MNNRDIVKIDKKYSYYTTSNEKDERLLHYWKVVCDGINTLSFVQRKEWFDAYLKSEIKKNCYYCFVVMLDNDKAIAIFPMQYCHIKKFGISLNVWQILSPDELGVNDLIFNPNSLNVNYISHLIYYLNNKQTLPWDRLELKNCPQGGAVDTELLKHNTFRIMSEVAHSSDYLNCTNQGDNSVINHSAKFKRNLRRLRRKLNECGMITTCLCDDCKQLSDAFDEFMDVESSGWKGENNSALIQDLKLQSFYRQIINTFGQTNSCFIYTLKLDGQAIASQLCIVTGETYNMLKIGFDEKYKAYSPGALLIENTVNMLIDQTNINKISFVTGGGWQRKWAPETIFLSNHCICNGTLKGIICYLLDWEKSKVKTTKHYLFYKRLFQKICPKSFFLQKDKLCCK